MTRFAQISGVFETELSVLNSQTTDVDLSGGASEV